MDRIHTICCATSAQNRVTACVLDHGNNGAWGRGALNENKLVLKIGVDLANAYTRERRYCESLPLRYIGRLGGIVPSSLYNDVEISLTQPSQVIGTEKVVSKDTNISISEHINCGRVIIYLERLDHGGEVDPMPGQDFRMRGDWLGWCK